ncbi:MAG: hypothetical protein PHC41_07050 [Lachnospiraceae bacterium]|nr:hypothetical protein [Lachnospiraceae bacterium]MDD3615970.1 hypothetical protein [Lachnospiraceae bacterium]
MRQVCRLIVIVSIILLAGCGKNIENSTVTIVEPQKENGNDNTVIDESVAESTNSEYRNVEILNIDESKENVAFVRYDRLEMPFPYTIWYDYSLFQLSVSSADDSYYEDYLMYLPDRPRDTTKIETIPGIKICYTKGLSMTDYMDKLLSDKNKTSIWETRDSIGDRECKRVEYIQDGNTITEYLVESDGLWICKVSMNENRNRGLANRMDYMVQSIELSGEEKNDK